MKKVFSFLIVFVLLSTVQLLGQVTKLYDFDDFTGVSVSAGMEVEIIQSDNYSIEVTAEEDVFDILKVEKSGDDIEFYYEKGYTKNSREVYIKITMPMLDDLDLSSGSWGKIDMDIQHGDIEIDLSAGSRLEGNLICGDLNFDASGGSNIKLSGRGGILDYDASGGTICDMSNFVANDVDADISGGGKLLIELNGRLDADLSGGSQLIYSGNATNVDANTSGGSTVRKK